MLIFGITNAISQATDSNDVRVKNTRGHPLWAHKKVPNFNLFAELLLNPFPKQSLLPMEVLIVSGSHPA